MSLPYQNNFVLFFYVLSDLYWRWSYKFAARMAHSSYHCSHIFQGTLLWILFYRYINLLELVQIKEFSNYRNVIAEVVGNLIYALAILLLFCLLKRVDGQNTISRKHWSNTDVTLWCRNRWANFNEETRAKFHGAARAWLQWSVDKGKRWDELLMYILKLFMFLFYVKIYGNIYIYIFLCKLFHVLSYY